MGHKAGQGGQMLSDKVKFLKVVQVLDGLTAEQRTYNVLNLLRTLGEIE